MLFPLLSTILLTAVPAQETATPDWLDKPAADWPRLFAPVEVQLTRDDLRVEVARGALLQLEGRVLGVVSSDSVEFSTDDTVAWPVDEWPDGPWLPLFERRDLWSAMRFRATTPEGSDWTSHHRGSIPAVLENVAVDALGFEVAPGTPPVPILTGSLDLPNAGDPVWVCGPDYGVADRFIVARGRFMTQRAPNWYGESFFVELEEALPESAEGWLPLSYGLVLDSAGHAIGLLRDTRFELQGKANNGARQWAQDAPGHWRRLAADPLTVLTERPADLLPARELRLPEGSRGERLQLHASGQLSVIGDVQQWIDLKSWKKSAAAPLGPKAPAILVGLDGGDWLVERQGQLQRLDSDGERLWGLATAHLRGKGLRYLNHTAQRAAFLNSDGELLLIDLQLGKWTARSTKSDLRDAAATWGSKAWFAATRDGRLLRVAPEAVRPPKPQRLANGALWPLVGGSELLAAGIQGQQRVALIDAERGKLRGYVPPFGRSAHEVLDLEFHPDGRHLAVLSSTPEAGSPEAASFPGAELSVWDVSESPARQVAVWTVFEAQPLDVAALGSGRLGLLQADGRLREFQVPVRHSPRE